MNASELRQWTLDRLVQEVIKRGKESLRNSDHGPAEIAGGLEGFDICAAIEPTIEAYEKVLAEREKQEWQLKTALNDGRSDLQDYWRYRYGTLQIEFTYQVLRVAYKAYPLSARAVRIYADIVGVAE